MDARAPRCLRRSEEEPRVYLLGEQPFVIDTDHASLRTAIKSSHLSQRTTCWLSILAEYTFVVHCEPDKTNILADTLSWRPDDDLQAAVDADSACDADELVNGVAVSAVSSVRDAIMVGYQEGEMCFPLLTCLSKRDVAGLKRLSARTRAREHESTRAPLRAEQWIGGCSTEPISVTSRASSFRSTTISEVE